MLRGDSAFGTKKVITACVTEGVEFSLAVSRNKRINAAIEAIDEDTYTPVHYPGAVEGPRHGGVDLRCRGRRNPLHRCGWAAAARSPCGWWCAGSKTPATRMRCFRCGAITRL